MRKELNRLIKINRKNEKVVAYYLELLKKEEQKGENKNENSTNK